MLASCFLPYYWWGGGVNYSEHSGIQNFVFENILPKKNTRTACSNEEKRQSLVIDVFHLIYKMPQHNMKSKLKLLMGRGNYSDHSSIQNFVFENIFKLPKKNTRTALSNEKKRQNLVIDVFHLIYKMPQHNMKSKF